MKLFTDSIYPNVLNTFEYLHANGEISWEEVQTTSYIQSILEQHGCETITFNDCTGVIGKYGSFDKNLPIVAIRADMDALWQEVNGTFQPNHSCGHDAHMSIVLGVLWSLEQLPNIKEQVAIKFIFQPAEETGTGALKMVEKGVVDDVDYLYGIHLRPFQETEDGRATPMIVHGATQSIEMDIQGHDAHGARPHLNKNAINIGMQIVNGINAIRLTPNTPHSVKVTRFQAGGKNTNIIPGRAHLALDLRAQTNELMAELIEEVKQVVEGVKHQTHTHIEFKPTHGIAAAVTNEEAVSIMKEAICETLGEEKVDPRLVSPGGDDFHFYTIKRPNIKATMLGLGCDLQPGLHHPQMEFNHKSMIHGVKILTNAIFQTYNLPLP
ncbi:M20 peptidase aminoacylase family protein [Pontibacillus litoralis]|uniref:Amidohydrolase n=1 Tax=Pontibacillus litoralis JSM 072002 TaxID=1385512 RepID=A0A0A5FZU3_9BACI|nr:M20 peptidase aminoacylase family protein [Pontibacillus litoralis]KGX86351.1 amidohydrolase [Pontibacillus litoralis JSM 072002]